LDEPIQKLVVTPFELRWSTKWIDGPDDAFQAPSGRLELFDEIDRLSVE
jgi:hypothetical protein